MRLPTEILNMLAPPADASELGRLGSYRILKLLGAGGMGLVFQAEDTALARMVALKLLKSELAGDDASRQRFFREARAAAAIEHEHIVTIYEVGQQQGVSFLAQQLLQGETLEDRLQREGPLPVGEVQRIGREIAAGLAAAHEQGLIHRDIKPANVWLEVETGRVKLLDFGLARTLGGETRFTQTGFIAGTPQYMPPEQAAGREVDARGDLFSLGCLLYRALTGELPFPGSNPLAVMRSLAIVQPKPPRELSPAVPTALSKLTMRLLAKAPRKRPKSARAVEQAIADIQRRLDRPGRRLTRKQAVLVTALLLLLVLVGARFWRSAANADRFVTQSAPAATPTVVPITGSVSPPASLPTSASQETAVERLHEQFEGEEAHRVAFSPDGRRAVIATTNPRVDGRIYNLRVWNLSASEEEACIRGRFVAIRCMAFSPDGEQLFIASSPRRLQLWDIAASKMIRSSSAAVLAAAIDPLRGRFLLSAPGGRVHLWDLKQNRMIHEMLGHAVNKPIYAVAISEDGQIGLTGGGQHHGVDESGTDYDLRLWDLRGGTLICRLSGHTNQVRQVAISADNRQALSSSFDGMLIHWDLETKTVIERIEIGGRLILLAPLPDFRHALVGSATGPVHLVNLVRHEIEFQLPLKEVRCLACSTDGRQALVGDRMGNVRLFQIPHSR